MLPEGKSASYFGGLVLAICDLMRTNGISKGSAERELKRALERSYAPIPLGVNRQIPPISRYAEVCARWHFDKRYLDENGSPEALSWDGRKGRLLDLVARVVGRKHARQVIEELITRRLIKRSASKCWIPKGKVVAPSGLDRAQALRVAIMMGRLLRTVAHNTKLKYRGDVIFEVMAQVPRLPSRHLREFRKLAKTQGLIFARTMDDWLETRNLTPAKARRISSQEAGIVAFAFHEPSFR